MKRTALLIAMTAFPAISFAASQNTITFKGQVSDQTCQVSVNGNAGSPIVVLRTADRLRFLRRISWPVKKRWASRMAPLM